MNTQSLPIPPEEHSRLASLIEYDILDTLNDEELDGLTTLTASIFKVPIALITVLDEKRQWFKSTYGVSIKETERSISFCQYTIMGKQVLEIENTLIDQRFISNPLVIGSPYIRFYCGAPLINEAGYVIGTLAILDKKPRKLDDPQKDTLTLLAKQIINVFELKRKRKQLEEEKALLKDRIEQRTKRLAKQIALLQERDEQLLQSEKLLKETQKLAKIGSCEYDLRTKQLLASIGLYDILEVSEDTYALATLDAFYHFIHKDDFRKAEEDFTHCVQKGESCTIEYRICTKAGQQKFILTYLDPLKEANGAIEKVRATLQDITDYKLAQEALRRSEALFASVFRLNPLPTAITRLSDGKVVAANEKALQAFGYSWEEISNATTSELHLWEKDENRQGFLDYLQRHSFYHFEKTYRNKAGEKWNAMSYIEIIEWEKEPCLLIVLQDITERKKAEEAIKAYTQQLEEINANKDKFFSIIAHDLLSPLNGMLGSSSLLHEYIDNLSKAEIQALAQAIYLSSTNLKRLLSNLLDWSRMQTGVMAFAPKEVNLRQVIQQVVELLKDNAQKKEITINIHLQEDIYLEADENMLESILRNLLANSIKFSRKGTQIVLTAGLTYSHVRVSIQDQGIGMNKEIQERLFKVGSKLSTLGTDNEKGTGLGLLLCKEFAEKHGGTIWVESEPGKGSVFTFTLSRQISK